MSKNTAAIIVKDVVKSFRLPHERHNTMKSTIINFRSQNYEDITVIDGVSFEIKKGEFFGIVGRNGSGKSTLLKMLAGVYQQTSGDITINGTLVPFIELGVGFNPELSGRDNVYLNGALLGFSRKEMDDLYDTIVDFAELEQFMDQKLKNYSSGMQVRLAFSIAIRADADILLLDEVLAVGDYNFQQKCFEYFNELKKSKKTVIFVSHDIVSVRKFCTQAVHLNQGKIVASGDVGDVVASYNEENSERAEEQEAQKTEKTKVSGTGDIEITNVYSTNLDGTTQNVFKPNEDMLFHFDITAKAAVKTPVFGMIFSDKAGRVVFATNTLDEKQATKSLKKNEKMTISYQINNLYEDGSYVVSGAVANTNRSVVFARADNAHEFRIVGDDRTAVAPFYNKPTFDFK